MRVNQFGYRHWDRSYLCLQCRSIARRWPVTFRNRGQIISYDWRPVTLGMTDPVNGNRTLKYSSLGVDYELCNRCYISHSGISQDLQKLVRYRYGRGAC